MPERKKNSLVLNLTKIWSAKKKRIDAVNKWLTKPSFKVSKDSLVNENSIKQIKFICTVVEKAITTFESTCIIILSVESITPITAR